MDKKNSEKEVLTDDNEEKSFIKKIYWVVRSNWVAFAFALLITVITVVAVPIVYSLTKNTNSTIETRFQWNITGITVVSQQTLLYGKNNSLGYIIALQFDTNADMYLLDQTQHRILKYSMQQNILTLIAGRPNGTSGADNNSFNSPNDLLIDQLNNNLMYIADTGNHRIQLWNPTTSQGATVFGTGQPGSDSNSLSRPMSVTKSQNSILYIADYGNNRIVSYDLNSNQINISLTMQTGADRNTYVITPISIKFDVDSLVIGQQSGYNAVRWKIGAPSWTLIAGSASSELNGTSRTLFNQVTGVETDKFRNTYVVDGDNQRIQFYQGDLTKGKTIAGVIQAKGNNSYILNQPSCIVLDRNRNVYVADSNNFRVQQFQLI